MAVKLDPDETFIERFEEDSQSITISGELFVTNKGIVFKDKKNQESIRIHNILYIIKEIDADLPCLSIEFLDENRTLTTAKFKFTPKEKTEGKIGKRNREISAMYFLIGIFFGIIYWEIINCLINPSFSFLNIYHVLDQDKSRYIIIISTIGIIIASIIVASQKRKISTTITQKDELVEAMEKLYSFLTTHFPSKKQGARSTSKDTPKGSPAPPEPSVEKAISDNQINKKESKEEPKKSESISEDISSKGIAYKEPQKVQLKTHEPSVMDMKSSKEPSQESLELPGTRIVTRCEKCGAALISRKDCIFCGYKPDGEKEG